MDYILLMLKISSLQTILILLRIPGGQFFTSSCLYSLFGIQKIFQFPTTVPEREKYFPPLDLPFFCRYKLIPSLKNLPSPAPNESLPYWSQGNFAASFVCNFCLREFLSSAFAYRFVLRCEPKRLMLLYYKICPC